MSKKNQILGLLAWYGVTFVAATLGSTASIQARDFYAELAVPSWAPPGSVFGPVWTLLYILMAFAAWWVWRVGGFVQARVALGLFLAQLVFNALWSWLFFAWKQGGLAFVNIILLWMLIAATLLSFYRLRRLSGFLLIPYLAWVSFATVLNFSIWQLNPNLL